MEKAWEVWPTCHALHRRNVLSDVPPYAAGVPIPCEQCGEQTKVAMVRECSPEGTEWLIRRGLTR